MKKILNLNSDDAQAEVKKHNVHIRKKSGKKKKLRKQKKTQGTSFLGNIHKERGRCVYVFKCEYM